MKLVSLRVTIDIDYDASGMTAQELAEMAHRAVRHDMGNGRFTGLSDATVENWSCKVEQIAETFK